MNRSRGSLRAALAALAAVPALAAPAQAAPQWHSGAIARTQVLNCGSVIIGNPRLEIGVMASAQFFADSNDLPDVGQVFYGRTEVGAVGSPCAGQSVAVEVVPPAGVEL